MSASDILAVQQAEAILQWYLENGVDEVMSSSPVDRLALKPVTIKETEADHKIAVLPQAMKAPAVAPETQAESKAEAIRLASEAQTLEDLKAAIQKFEGLSLKKTAMNMVFAAGNPLSSVMVIGDAPEAEDDRAGIPFAGEVGELTDKMFAAIGLIRQGTTPETSIYLTNVLNWRPPGNRTPVANEIDLALPFIRRHIELVKPKIIYLMGGIASKAVLGSDLTIGKLRGQTHMAQWDGFECVARVSYHPSFLLRSPLKKREAWDDLQALKALL